MKLSPFKSTLLDSTLFKFSPFKLTLSKSTLFKLIVIKILSSVLISFLLFSCSKEDDGIYFNENTNEVVISKVSYSDMESEILSLVNAHRKSLNLSELNLLNIISSEAVGHTNYMIAAGQASHDNFQQRSQYLLTNANAKTVGENVAYGFNTAQGVVNGWLKSTGHKKIIENSNYTHFGISTGSDNQGRNYFTHIFIST